MASYLDNIPTFNEYVEQRPQDEMLKVGLFKQQRYEEGVQRIQKSIDNIAGLDVVRDVDKKYLQSKLNSLGSQLSGVAGGDFSNFQLVNTVDGMTNQLVKDPNILNAVGSAAKYRKQLENQEKINVDGKGSQSNDWDFNRRVQQWYDGGLEDSFNAQFKPYVNYNEEAMKIVKALASDSTENDVYMGKDKNGRTVIYDAITRTKIEGITPDKIQTALSAGLTPDAFAQMGIDGEFQYSNQDDEIFSQNVNESYSSTFNALLEERNSLESLMSKTSTAEKKIQIQNQIDALDAQTNLLKEEYDNVSSTFTNGDVDSAKARLFSTNWMRDFSNSMSSQNVSQTIQTNPFKTVQLKQMQMQQAAAQFNAKYQQTEKYNKSRLKIEQAKLDLVKDPYGGVSQSNPGELSPAEIIARAEVNISNDEKLLETRTSNVLSKYNITPDELSNMMILLDSNPASLRSDIKQDLIQIQKLYKKNTNSQNVITQLRDESKLLSPDPRGDGGTLTLDEYNYTTAEASDLYKQFAVDYMDDVYVDSLPMIFMNPGSTNKITDESYALAEQELTPKEFNLFKLFYIEEQDANNPFEFNDPYDVNYVNPQDKRDIDNNIRDYMIDTRGIMERVNEERNQYISDELAKTTIIPQAVSYQVPLTNTAEKSSFSSALLGIANDRQSLDADFANKIRTIANDISIANVITQSLEGGDYQLTIVGDGGGPGTVPNKETISLSEAQYEELFQGRFDKSPEVQFFDDNYLNPMLNTVMPLIPNPNSPSGYSKDNQTFWTTATDGQYETTAENAGLSGQADFPNTQYYGVSGNLVSDNNPKSLETTYKLILNIYDPVTDKLIPSIMPEMIIRKEQVGPTLQTITDEVIYQILNGTDAQFTNEKFNELKKAAEGNQN